VTPRQGDEAIVDERSAFRPQSDSFRFSLDPAKRSSIKPAILTRGNAFVVDDEYPGVH
jgi:hypothetical protein